MKNLPYIVILVLVGIVLFQTCGKKKPVPEPTVVTVTKTDTFIKLKHDTLPGKPILIRSEPIVKWDTLPGYTPDTSYEKLKVQYDNMGNNYFARNVYSERKELGDSGYVEVIDTLERNLIVGRRFNIGIPTKTIVNNTTTTITKYAEPKTQVFIGGGITGNQTQYVNGAEAGIVIKSKKDQLYQIKAYKSFDNTPVSFGISTFWKIGKR